MDVGNAKKGAMVKDMLEAIGWAKVSGRHYLKEVKGIEVGDVKVEFEEGGEVEVGG